MTETLATPSDNFTGILPWVYDSTALGSTAIGLPAPKRRAVPEIPLDNAVSLREADAALALGVSADHFRRHVAPHIRKARIGSIPVYPVDELRRFMEEVQAAPEEALRRRRASARKKRAA